MGSRLRQGPLPIDANSWSARIFNRPGTHSVRVPQDTRAGRGSPHSLFQTPDFTLSPLLSSGQPRTRGHGIISLLSLWKVGRADRALTRHLEPQLATWKAANNPPLGSENSPDQSKFFFFFPCWGRGHPCLLNIWDSQPLTSEYPVSRNKRCQLQVASGGQEAKDGGTARVQSRG